MLSKEVLLDHCHCWLGILKLRHLAPTLLDTGKATALVDDTDSNLSLQYSTICMYVCMYTEEILDVPVPLLIVQLPDTYVPPPPLHCTLQVLGNGK
jgi:hypothetical protein